MALPATGPLGTAAVVVPGPLTETTWERAVDALHAFHFSIEKENRLAGTISRGQALSMFSALAFIYVILIVFFLDWRTALMALIPNALVVVFFFGLLGASGVTLNLATSIIGTVREVIDRYVVRTDQPFDAEAVSAGVVSFCVHGLSPR